LSDNTSKWNSVAVVDRQHWTLIFTGELFNQLFGDPAVQTLIILGIGYMLLDIWLFEVDRCSPLICTEGYPCFEQGDCPSSKVPD
jgi:hypothetical protein